MTPVDDLIRDLGELRVAADATRADAVAQRAIEAAIWEATHEVGATIRDPGSEAALSRAQAAIRRTATLISALTSEDARSRRIASTAIGLRLVTRTRRDWKP